MEIPLNGLGEGKFATVDPEDYPFLSRYKWFYRNGYALTDIKGKETRMHRLVMHEHDENIIIDHINRNRLDNRKSNLRRFTPKQNANNMSTNRKIYAFGEWKNVAEWADDPRCGCTYAVLLGRLRKEIDPEICILASGKNI